MTAFYDRELKQMDVKTAFLHGDLIETIYTSQPLSFIDNSKHDHVCFLRKSIWGLKQYPREWYIKFSSCIC